MAKLSPLLFAFALLCSLSSLLVAGQVENDDPRGKVLFVSEPSCDSWRCQVKWRQGTKHRVNWFNPPRGKVSIKLVPQEGTTGLKEYTLTPSVSGKHHGDKCDRGEQKDVPCGMFSWTVPLDTVPGQYMIEVASLKHPDLVGYTDTVVITKARKNKSRRSQGAVGQRLHERRSEDPWDAADNQPPIDGE
ncbi:uncharacterized protein PFL1_04034 [Pseudozyma flocculosa PF-1]|uniref:Uncharacterized protein n=2 Tax=Pseudozyma flocculosa TaxID=84751 RepID=A0A061HC61_9BASI|nr:uncharacterized protein PFL1_04034 [Pseudozyma flocculosa PF-1]EPQ28206.1 hypothetical protein PFL1_04034 [Pseudozyma flocculosa PF-1]SPO35343.1 related to conserved hypothetical Ustilaginaceae-specific protein [Pseudozyma flocculosa]